ncbi:glutamate--cysteine ligase [Clostridium formicaceticum]|uniref:Glutamate--cysteine ligase n=1 Tax=Clostridium formicaceticum TaxID=1497 RepID=A0AAC9WI00_9CLOT|nr:glutamate-cysteine ligase family protein [Clostridium formicaceticum]AOY75206.1 glutamate--cysteine ligase [Clostridium formicaceticum]ARE89637.1 Glutamate--cysteine ligase GshA [Clostridium formicaceticum]
MQYEEQIKTIVAFIKSGEKEKKDFNLGVEIEHIVIKKESFDSVTYYEEEGIQVILNKLAPQGYTLKYEDNYLLALEGKTEIITLEPGGQLEVSMSPTMDIKEIEANYLNFLKKVIPILEEQNQLLMAIGYHPKTSIKDIPFNPKTRYQYMADYFKKKGKYAHNMMKGTASLQVVIDYANEEDFIKKFKVANFLSPLLHLMTDNAPIFEGEVFEKNSIRNIIWENTDKDRSSIVPGTFKGKFGYREYAEYILNTPPIFIIKDGALIPTYDKKVKDLLDPYHVTQEEISHILSMVFPDVRVRKYIEIRMGDTLPYPLNLGYIALIKGLFYNEIALEYLYEMANNLEEEKVRQAKEDIIEKGFEGRYKCKVIYDFVPVLFDLAKKGLKEEEKGYLKTLENLTRHEKNPALLSKRLIKSKGIEALTWCALNRYGG